MISYENSEKILTFGICITNGFAIIFIGYNLILSCKYLCSNNRNENLYKTIVYSSLFGILFHLLWCIFCSIGIYIMWDNGGVWLEVQTFSDNILWSIGNLFWIWGTGWRYIAKSCVNLLYITRLDVTFRNSNLEVSKGMIYLLYFFMLLEAIVVIIRMVSFIELGFYSKDCWLFGYIDCWTIVAWCTGVWLILDGLISVIVTVLFSVNLGKLLISLGYSNSDYNDLSNSISLNKKLFTQKLWQSATDGTSYNDVIHDATLTSDELTIPDHSYYMDKTNGVATIEYEKVNINRTYKNSDSDDEKRTNTIVTNPKLDPQGKLLTKKIVLVNTITKFCVLSIASLIATETYSILLFSFDLWYYQTRTIGMIIFMIFLPLDSIINTATLNFHFWFSQNQYRKYCICHNCCKKIFILMIKHKHEYNQKRESLL